MRLCACLGIGLDVIEPCGFPWNEQKIRRSGLDYMSLVDLKRHSSWKKFLEDKGDARIILMTTKAATPYTEFTFKPDDILLAGQESAGVPDNVHNRADGRVIIPMHGEARSLNVVNATSMIIGEALRQNVYENLQT